MRLASSYIALFVCFFTGLHCDTSRRLGAAADDALAKTTWRLVTLTPSETGRPLPASTLHFDTHHHLIVVSECTKYTLDYATPANDVITFSRFGRGHEVCDAPQGARTGRLVEALHEVARFENRGGRLVLYGSAGETLATFERYERPRGQTTRPKHPKA